MLPVAGTNSTIVLHLALALGQTLRRRLANNRLLQVYILDVATGIRISSSSIYHYHIRSGS